MNEQAFWFSTGFEHITDAEGYDHILFVSLLVFAWPLEQYKKLLWLVTAFTLGHSLSLALSMKGMVDLPRNLTECLIAFSILISLIYQLFTIKRQPSVQNAVIYFIVACFGLIHGLGFSGMLHSLLGRNSGVALPLVYFNLGLEAGQLLIVGAVVLFSLFLTRVLKVPYQRFKLICLCSIALITLKLCAERLLLLL